ncbi:MAG: hypothetical protein LC776_07465, partial [Acidobacteria bacterium]|nr:hypothetical protein [Acidobacteriota bacterium]
VLAIRNVTVISGTGADPIRNATVLIRDERITAIGPAAEIVVPAGARVVEGAGKFLLPGFIEMHAHISKTRASALVPCHAIRRSARSGFSVDTFVHLS